MVRACSYRDPDPYRHSGDYVAAALPGTPLRLGARLGPFRRLLGRFSRRGLYEWVVARTRYVDDVFERFGPSMAQVLIMGAGYDSRAIRFEGALRSARVFEVDAPAPQADKRRGLELRKLPVPANLVFVPVDFETQSAATRLAEAGFRPGLATLFVLEGLTMYLEPATVDGTLQTVADLAGGGSVLVFDYAYADVSGKQFLLPSEAETTMLYQPNRAEVKGPVRNLRPQTMRNLLEFRDYRKFAVDSDIDFGGDGKP